MGYVFPNTVCVVGWRGGRIHLNPDQQWDENDPFVQERPEFFAADPMAPQRTEPVVERATRAPGERRPARRPAASKKAPDTGE